MCRSPWATAAVATALLFGGGCVLWNGQRMAQPSGAVSLRKLIEERQAVLDQNERRRLEIVSSLTFTPRPFLPGPSGSKKPKICLAPPFTPAAVIDPHRSLLVHDSGTLSGADFSLNRTLTQIASQVVPVPGTTATTIFRQLWDTQNAASTGTTPGPHCDDAGGTVNGFPINCPRNEGSEAFGTTAVIAAKIIQYQPLALVNRLDLAHQGWRNCGEYRIIYGRNDPAGGRNFIIFEAVLPNPKPGCREGCLQVAEFWKSLSTINNAVTRAKELEKFFYAGLQPYRPVVHVDHYSALGVSTGYGSSGTGQIRTNQFMQTGGPAPWLLKEFKTVIACGTGPCTFHIVPIMVKVNPYGPLWNEDDPHPLGPAFRANTAAPVQLARLSSSELMKIGYEVDLDHDAGQSMSLPGVGFVDDYLGQMNSATATGFRALLGAGPAALTADQIANRALAQSCVGCHAPVAFGIILAGSIGTVTTPAGVVPATIDSWPDAVWGGFVHVDSNSPSVRPELSGNSAVFGAGFGQVISPALLDFFLPDRKNFLVAQLNAPRCACVPIHFDFFPYRIRNEALAILAATDHQFAAKLDAIDQRALESAAMPEEKRVEPGQLLREREEVLAQRDEALAEQFRKAGIAMPDAEHLDLRPQTMKLRAGAASLTREVNQLLKKEPPRRTVTGVFRAH